LATAVGTDIFLGAAPATPNVLCVVSECKGTEPTPAFGERAAQFESARVQVMFRGAASDYNTPRAAAQSAYEACIQNGPFTMNSVAYLLMMPRQLPHVIQQDASSRFEIGFRMTVEREVTT
jgi:hypothetical protein